MTRHIALLRGINLGKRRIKMDDLRSAFEDLGFQNVRTLIASGNVVFDSDQADGILDRIESGLLDRFGFEVPTVLRQTAELDQIVQSNPFAEWPEDAPIQRYVLFLADPVPVDLDLPHVEAGDFEVISATTKDLFVVAHRQPDGRNGPGLDKWVKRFKSGVTNRNWNTTQKLNQMAKT